MACPACKPTEKTGLLLPYTTHPSNELKVLIANFASAKPVAHGVHAVSAVFLAQIQVASIVEGV